MKYVKVVLRLSVKLCELLLHAIMLLENMFFMLGTVQPIETLFLCSVSVLISSPVLLNMYL